MTPLFIYFRISRHCETNNMNCDNLAICWWPALIRPGVDDIQAAQAMAQAMLNITKTLISQHGFFFYNEHEV